MLLEASAAALASAGLTRVNVSYDSLRVARFESIRRRDDLATLLRTLEVAEAAGLAPIKINVQDGGFQSAGDRGFDRSTDGTSHVPLRRSIHHADGGRRRSSSGSTPSYEIACIGARVRIHDRPELNTSVHCR